MRGFKINFRGAALIYGLYAATAERKSETFTELEAAMLLGPTTVQFEKSLP